MKPTPGPNSPLTQQRSHALWILLTGLVCCAQATPPGPPPPPSPPQDRPVTTLQCRVLNFNYGGRGEIQGFMANAAGKLIQVNAANELHDALKTLHSGDLIDIAIMPQDGPPGPGRGPQDQPDHPIGELVRLRNAQGQVFNRPEPPDPSMRQHVTIQSTIVALNYDHRGMPDGIQLANGDLVQLGPDADYNFSPNQPVAIVGSAEPMADGGRLIHAQAINGQPIQQGPGGPPPPPPGGPDPGP